MLQHKNEDESKFDRKATLNVVSHAPTLDAKKVEQRTTPALVSAFQSTPMILNSNSINGSLKSSACTNLTSTQVESLKELKIKKTISVSNVPHYTPAFGVQNLLSRHERIETQS